MFQSTPDMENMQSRLEAQERFWKSRLKQVETEHKRELDRLRVQLDHAKGNKLTVTAKWKSTHWFNVLKTCRLCVCSLIYQINNLINSVELSTT
jgi:hypothetical protein